MFYVTTVRHWPQMYGPVGALIVKIGGAQGRNTNSITGVQGRVDSSACDTRSRTDGDTFKNTLFSHSRQYYGGYPSTEIISLRHARHGAPQSRAWRLVRLDFTQAERPSSPWDIRGLGHRAVQRLALLVRIADLAAPDAVLAHLPGLGMGLTLGSLQQRRKTVRNTRAWWAKDTAEGLEPALPRACLSGPSWCRGKGVPPSGWCAALCGPPSAALSASAAQRGEPL